MMSDVTEKILDQNFDKQEHLTVVELTDKELEEVHGAIAVAAQTLAISGLFTNIALNQAAIAGGGGFGGGLGGFN